VILSDKLGADDDTSEKPILTTLSTCIPRGKLLLQLQEKLARALIP